ncbi:MAG: hypothetical protein GTO18_01200 [Anaerolineales bacterium]|nr:hypothetical protein [Anaerolineales bacterium]
MSLQGKGFFIWKIPYVEKGDPEQITARAVEAGLSHVLIKIADGTDWVYNYNYDKEIDLVPPLRDAMREAGLQVWGWHYVRGNDPAGEAQLAVTRMNELRLDGFVVDAEAEYKEPEKDKAAKRFMQDLRNGLPNTPIALSTFRYPEIHKPFPFNEFLEKCDYAMPQIYFERAHNPEEQVERSAKQFSELEFARPIISTGPTYKKGGWKPSPDEINRFMTKARELGQPGVNFWSMLFCRRDMMDVWQTIADFEWPVEAPQADIVERLIGRLNQKDSLMISDLYQHNAAHVTGARTVVGREHITDWYNVLFTQLLPNAAFELTGKSGSGNSRHFTWTAVSDQGIVMDGNDTLGLRNGSIQYHYTYFTIN